MAKLCGLYTWYLHFIEFIMNATTKHVVISLEAALDYMLTNYILTDDTVTGSSSLHSFHQPIRQKPHCTQAENDKTTTLFPTHVSNLLSKCLFSSERHKGKNIVTFSTSGRKRMCKYCKKKKSEQICILSFLIVKSL